MTDDRESLRKRLMRERFGKPEDAAREATNPPPLTDAQRAANRRELDRW